MLKRTCSSIIAALACLAVGSVGASAGTLTGVTTVADLGTVTSIDWGQFGAEGTFVSTPSLFFAADGSLGLVGQIGGAPLVRLDQSSLWNGNFSPGEHLLFNLGSGQDIGVALISGLYTGVGAYVEPNAFGDFLATITVYDSTFTPFGSFSATGFSDSTNDGTALFIGIKDTDQEIAAFSFTVVDSIGNVDNFSIGTAYISAVPEPGSLAMLAGVGLSGAVFVVRRRRK